jgi:hypothetical protein
VSERLAHGTIAITLDIYRRVTPTLQREAAHVVAGHLRCLNKSATPTRVRV